MEVVGPEGLGQGKASDLGPWGGLGWLRAKQELGIVWDSRWACVVGSWFLTSSLPSLGQVLPYQTSPGVGPEDKEILLFWKLKVATAIDFSKAGTVRPREAGQAGRAL